MKKIRLSVFFKSTIPFPGTYSISCRNIFQRFYLFIFRERKGGRKRGRETSVCERNIHWLLLAYWPATCACALTGNQTSNLLVRRLALSPLSHTSQGKTAFLIYIKQLVFLAKFNTPKCHMPKVRLLKILVPIMPNVKETDGENQYLLISKTYLQSPQPS